MSFFNSLAIRIPLALIGGILYSLLAYGILLSVEPLNSLALPAGLFIFVSYVGSRLLLLFSGYDSPYYARGRLRQPNQSEHFFRASQWVGKFYRDHDLFLFAFLILICLAFIITGLFDWAGHRPLGETIQNLWERITFAR
jgi:hypothetical protein